MNSKKSCYKVKNGKIKKRILVPSSKSHANRALILAALSKFDVTLENMPPSTDVLTMLNCFEAIGLIVIRSESSIIIKGSFPECEPRLESSVILKTGDGGTTNRFLLPLLALGKNTYIIEPTGHMKTRPMETLFSCLEELEVSVIRNEEIWASIQGPIITDLKELFVDASVSSQFASGLALSLSSLGVETFTKNIDGSEAYFELTKHLIAMFCSTANPKQSYTIPVDFSSLSYPVALSLFQESLEVENCYEVDQFQPDSKFLQIIKTMGGDYDFNKGFLTISAPTIIKAQTIDCKEFPDLVPTLAFCFSYGSGETILKNLRSLRVKECDRVKEIMNILDQFNVENFLDSNDDLHIIGCSFPSVTCEVEVNPPIDHRMIMIGYLFQRLNLGGDLNNYTYVDKSFANFYEVMES